MPELYKKMLKYSILLGIGILLLWLSFRGQDFNQIWVDLKSADFSWIGLSIVVMLISHWFRAYRWNMLLEPLNYKPKMMHTFSAVIIGYMANLALPRMGEVSRCGILAKSDDIPFNKLIGTVVVERLVDVLSLFCLLVIVISIQFTEIFSFFNQYLFLPIGQKVESNGAFLLAVIVLFLLLGLLAWRLIQKNLQKLQNQKIISKIIQMVIGLKDGFVSIRSVKSPSLFIFSSIAIWSLYFLNGYLIFFSLSSTASLGPTVALVALAIGSIGMTAPVQGGIGAYHWMVSEGLMLYGLTKAEGLTFATISHASQNIAIIILGVILFIYMNIKQKKHA